MVAGTGAVTVYRRLAAANPAYEPELASSLNNLSNRLGEGGWGDEGLAAVKEARDLYQGLAAVDPAPLRVTSPPPSTTCQFAWPR